MRIVPVPLLDVLQDLFKGLGCAPLLQLQHPPMSAGLGRGRQEHLDLGVRQHHRADVPAVHNNVVGACQLPLHLQQVRPHRRVGGHGGGAHGYLRQTNFLRHILAVEEHMLQAILPIGQLYLKLRQSSRYRRFILGVNSGGKSVITDGAVDSAGIHI